MAIETSPPQETAAPPEPVRETPGPGVPLYVVSEAPAVHVPSEVLAEETPTLKQRVRDFRARHAKWELALFFFASFAYDIATLRRIDNWLVLTKQGLFLGVLGLLLLVELRWSWDAEPPRWLARVWRFREDALHFFLGGLLSPYTLFYFKSASGLTAFLFLTAVFGLLVANELPRFRALGPVVRVGLFSFCLTSYCAYLLPVVLGYYSGTLFMASVGLSCAATLLITLLVGLWSGDRRRTLRHVALPGLGIQGLLVALYLLRAIPPVPLSMLSSGIYHGVEVVKGPRGKDYRLLHERAGWRLWERGDQDFRARSGDRVYFFASVFAPTSFKPQRAGDRGTRLVIRWYYDDPEKGWTQFHAYDDLYLEQGGRERGFRTFAYVTNPRPGDWRVAMETEDGREIGRLSFTVTPDDSTAPREFKVDAG
ncbi:MAG TPA: DUF2914 domain-containing protein [Archangium sp.]|uniref:DUF2914 domain-containing protein n=1 Tax=Archangium sp. TaxID=1872627 RepID=UPI002E36973B|nr:DUF2914 domain-containing protein [Archangium sp.]HEX5750477.1 DUF2914 domain-containing protein [Archangium sp.]